MRCFIGLGSNLGNPQDNLENAARALNEISENEFKISPVYQNPAVLPENAPDDWNKPYFNAVAKIEWQGTAANLLTQLKMIEIDMGRRSAPRWAPRIIDLDLLTFGDEVIRKPSLQVPHSRILDRSFVLDPMKDISPTQQVPSTPDPVVKLARNLKSHQPSIMGILNITPDSFSDGGQNTDFKKKIREMDEIGVQIIDIGAESTRPNAQVINAHEEWLRLEPVLMFVRDYFKGRFIKPKISLDTYKASIAKKSLDLEVIDIINDVGGLQDPEMLNVLSKTHCDCVLMHNLALSQDCDPVVEIKKWLMEKLKILSQHQIHLDRIIFDLGIGFGKTAEQSISLIKRVDEFSDLSMRILVGHSRKSFMKKWGLENPRDRDDSTLFLSKELVSKGVDILRVHDYQSHMKAFV